MCKSQLSSFCLKYGASPPRGFDNVKFSSLRVYKLSLELLPISVCMQKCLENEGNTIQTVRQRQTPTYTIHTSHTHTHTLSIPTVEVHDNGEVLSTLRVYNLSSDCCPGM